MSTLTKADHEKQVACLCRTTHTWVVGQVNVKGKAIRIVVDGVIRPLFAFLEITRLVVSGTLRLLTGETLRASLCLNGKSCQFITATKKFGLQDFRNFAADPC